jgi:hypothetical protein
MQIAEIKNCRDILTVISRKHWSDYSKSDWVKLEEIRAKVSADKNNLSERQFKMFEVCLIHTRHALDSGDIGYLSSTIDSLNICLDLLEEVTKGIDKLEAYSEASNGYFDIITITTESFLSMYKQSHLTAFERRELVNQHLKFLEDVYT